MKIKNKIVSMLCAVSMVLTTIGVVTVSAAAQPKVSLDTALSADGTSVDFTISYSNFTDAAIGGFECFIPLSQDVFNVDATENAPVVDKEAGKANARWNDSKKAIYCSFMSTDPTDESTLITGETNTFVKFNVKLKNTSLEEKIDFNLERLMITNLESNVEVSYGTADAGCDVTLPEEDVTIKDIYPAVAITDITAADPIYTGKNVNLTAVLDDAAKLGDRVVSWTATNGTVTPNEADSTKAVLVPTADGKVTVTATVDNNGTAATFTKEFEATTKAEPKPYVISATGVSNGETTITVKVDTDYAGENASPAYKLVAQFYTADGTAAGWVSLDCAAVQADGTATYTMGAQNASKVSVTAYDADDNSIVGQN